MRIVNLSPSDLRTTHCIRQPTSEQVGKIRESIKERGLLYPLLVIKGNELVDGLTRLAACKQLGWKDVPCHVVEGTAADIPDILSIAQHLRTDLTRRQKGLLLLPLYEAEKKEAENRRRKGGKIPGKGRALRVGKTLGMKEKELDVTIKAIKLEQENPEVYGNCAKHLLDTTRPHWLHWGEMLKATEREQKREVHRLKADGEFSRIIVGDMLDVLPTLKVQFDAAITDAPYGVPGIKYDGEKDNSTPAQHIKWFRPCLDAMLSVVRPGGLVAFFQSYVYLEHFWKWFGDLDFELFWIGKFTDMTHGQYLVHAMDVCLICWKGVRHGAKDNPPRLWPVVLEGVDRRNWMTSQINQRPSALARIHRCAKSIDIMNALISFTTPGSTILDPFAGTGATLWAAELTGRRWLGIEKSPNYEALAWKRRTELMTLREHVVKVFEARGNVADKDLIDELRKVKDLECAEYPTIADIVRRTMFPKK